MVNSGKVTLYAYDGGQFLAWDRRQRFSDAAPPHRVYELDAATIPGVMQQALPNSLLPANASWAVALPAHMQKQIQHHLNRVDSGELHINRYQEVQHVPPG